MNKYRLASIGLRLAIIAINLCILIMLFLPFYTFSTSIMALTSNPEENLKMTFGFDNSTREYHLDIDFYVVNNGFIDVNTRFDGFISLVNGSIVKSSYTSGVVSPRNSLKLRLSFRFTESEILMYNFNENPPYLTLEFGFKALYDLIGLKFHLGNIRLGGGF
ncbi:MAG: hypothetical protein QXI93_01180 [Candidatus Methanomethylicia archaeon]